MKIHREHEINKFLYKKFLDREKDKDNKFSELQRGSMVAYLWGMKLAKFVKEIENI